MYEEMTFEYIMQQMMDNMPDGINTQEGSLIYNACAKQAVRLEEAYEDLASVEKNCYVTTADIEHLILIGGERGIFPEYATFATLKATFNTDMPINTKLYNDEYEYRIINCIDEENHIYTIICEFAGEDPNYIMGEVFPLEPIEGYEEGSITEVLIPGKDMEETEVYRKRLLEDYGSYRKFCGNRSYYLQALHELDQVGGAKLHRRVAGQSIINIEILNGVYDIPTNDIVKYVQEKIDPTQTSGQGDGIAPIGHKVTISAAVKSTVNIETTITYDDGYSYEGLKNKITEAVNTYLIELRKQWETADSLVIRILQIESRLVEIEGIVDVTGTKINNELSNLILNGQAPVLGDLVCR